MGEGKYIFPPVYSYFLHFLTAELIGQVWELGELGKEKENRSGRSVFIQLMVARGFLHVGLAGGSGWVWLTFFSDVELRAGFSGLTVDFLHSAFA